MSKQFGLMGGSEEETELVSDFELAEIWGVKPALFRRLTQSCDSSVCNDCTSNGDHCYDCDSGYYVSSGNCYACGLNCEECTSSECTKCDSGYKVESDGGSNCEYDSSAASSTVLAIVLYVVVSCVACCCCCLAAFVFCVYGTAGCCVVNQSRKKTKGTRNRRYSASSSRRRNHQYNTSVASVSTPTMSTTTRLSPAAPSSDMLYTHPSTGQHVKFVPQSQSRSVTGGYIRPYPLPEPKPIDISSYYSTSSQKKLARAGSTSQSVSMKKGGPVVPGSVPGYLGPKSGAGVAAAPASTTAVNAPETEGTAVTMEVPPS